MNKKGIVGDATIIIISLIIIGTLGIASFIIFGSDLFGKDVEQIIKEKQQGENMKGIIFDILKQDANYKGLNNLGLILYFLNDKTKFEIVNNKLNENLNFNGCWYIQINYESKVSIIFSKNDCSVYDMRYEPLASNLGKKESVKLSIFDLEKPLDLEFNLFYPEKPMELKPILP